MKVAQLIHVVEIARCQSLSQAAKNLGMTQPALSVSLGKLEEELQVQLFQRKNTGVIVTDKGKEVLELAESVLNDLEKIKKISNKGEANEEITVALPISYFNAFSAELVVAFYERYPDARLILTEVKLRPKPEHMGSEYNIGIGVMPMEKMNELLSVRDSQIVYEVLDKIKDGASHKIKLFLSKNHPLAEREVVTLEDIVPFQLIQWDADVDSSSQEKDYGLNIKTVQDRELLKKLVAQNTGISLLPEIFAYQDLYVEIGLIKVIDVEDLADLAEEWVAYMAYPTKELITSFEQSTVQLLKQHLLS